MAFISKNPKLTTTTLVDQVAGSVSSPASGSNKIINRNGILYLKSSAGVETPLGSGAAVKNYLSSVNDGSAAAVLATVTAAGNVVVSGTFPNVTSDWGRDSTSSIATSTDNSLRGTSNYLTSAGTSSTSGATFVQSPAFNIDGEDLGKALAVQFDVTGNTTADDWDCVAVRYDSAGTFGALIPIAGVASTTTGTASAQVPTGTTTFKGFFITGSTASDVYSIRWRRRAGAVQIRLDNLIVGPQSVMLGTAIQDIKTAAAGMTWTNVTLGTSTQVNVIKYGRAGDSATIYGTLELGTGGSFTGTVGGTIPTEIGTINTSVLNSSAVDYAIGSCWMRNENGASDPEYTGVVVFATGAGLIQFVPNSTADSRVNATQPFTWAVGDRLSYTIQIPITGWSSNVTMADRAVEEYASNGGAAGNSTSDTADFKYGPSGQLIGSISVEISRRVRFLTPIQATDKIEVELSADRVNWFSANNWFRVGSNFIQPFAFQGGTNSYGAGRVYYVSGSTDVDVTFGTYARTTSATYSAAGDLWSAGSGAAYWRVRKVSGGAAVGFPIAPANITLIDSADNYSGNTKLGFMKYLHGVSYNGGIAPTVTLSAGGGTLTTVNRAVFIPYQLADGIWRIKFNLNVTISSLSRTIITLAVNGITSISVSQCVTGFISGSGVSPRSSLAISTNTFSAEFSATTTDQILLSGDVELNAKPTWAY